jgi:hypothetical protein
LVAVAEELRDRFDPVDLEDLSSGMPRWEAHAGKAQQRLMRRGVLKDDSPRGAWELSDRQRKVPGGGMNQTTKHPRPLDSSAAQIRINSH